MLNLSFANEFYLKYSKCVSKAYFHKIRQSRDCHVCMRVEVYGCEAYTGKKRHRKNNLCTAAPSPQKNTG